MSHILYLNIAEQIKHFIKHTPYACLPSIPLLCKQFKTSPMTMLKALRLLRETGLIEFWRGSKIRINGRTGEGILPDCAAKSLADEIKSGLEKGSLKVGEQLPKISYLAKTGHVSRDTVCEALKMCANQNLINKSGRAWIVGPGRKTDHQPQDFSSLTDKRSPVVLILVPYYDHWRFYMSHFHAKALLNNIFDELQRCGITCKNVLAMENVLPSFVPAGKEEIAGMIKKLGSRYKGTLIATSTIAMDVFDWVRYISKFNMPAVLFVDNTVGAEQIASRLLPEKCYRCYYSEETVTTAAVNALFSRGHRKVLFINLPSLEKYEWYVSRRDLLEHYCASHNPAIEFSSLDVTEIDTSPSTSFEDSLRDVCLSGGNDTLRLEKIFKLMPSMKPLLCRELDITAVIAYNDHAAVQILLALQAAGIQVPRDLSLLSFDNNPAFALYPLTTIDMGYTRLGYFAAHLLIDDIPVRVDAQNNLVSQPFLSDRGTLGVVNAGS